VTETVRFEPGDFADSIPAPGFYAATVDDARYRRSSRGNDMIQVVYALAGMEIERHGRVAEYFVLDGGSSRGKTVSRRRLLQLYTACGLEPKAGDEVSPADLLGLRLEVRVAHDEWEGQSRLRVTGYRRLDPARTPF
jgi:hypothetical protein